MIRKDAWYNFDYLKFTKAGQVAQCVVYPEECSVKNQTKQRKERERKVGKKNRRKEGREKKRKSAWFWFKIFTMTFSFSFFFFLLGSRRWDGKYLCKLCLAREMSIQWLFPERKYNEDGLGEFMMTPTHRKQWKILNIWSKSQGI